jgi:type IX secretion system PorP/SprF family membrane protein
MMYPLMMYQCRKIAGLLIIMLGVSVWCPAQDVHFSQFFNTPLAVNPAQTGFFQGDYRVAANYRNQWHFVANPYRTYSVSYDMQLMSNLFSNDIVSGGLLLYSDRAGAGNLSNTTGQLSLSVQQLLGGGRYNLSIGLQGGMTQLQFNPGQLTFGDQIANDANSSQETFEHTGVTYPDLNAGVLWSGQFNSRITMFAGGALHHLTNPPVNFLGSDNRLAPRLVLHTGGSITLTDQIGLLPQLLYMRQKASNEFYGGANVRYQLP